MELVEVDINEFKNIIYPEYVNLFPKIERKPYEIIEKLYHQNILKILKIMDTDFVGFFITNAVENNKYLQVDYFGILPKYQNQGYGTRALELLIKQSIGYNGVFVEIESLGYGENETENKLRKKRAKFYENIGFHELNFKLKWFGSLMLSPYLFKTTNNEDSENVILESMLEIYESALGKENFNKKLEVIYNNIK